MTGFAGSCPSRYDPKRGQREVAGEFSVPDSEGLVFEAARGGIENTEECHVRVDKGLWNRVIPCAVTLLACVP